MKTDYILPFKGLSAGTHSFDFEVEKQFFEKFDYFENESGKLTVHVDLLKEANLMDLHFFLKGIVEMQCDRCLGKFTKPVEGNFRLIVKFGDHFEEESEEVVLIPVTESRLDLSQYIFEFINLLLPIQKTHENIADCDPEMIKKLEKYSKIDSDSRWDKLKNIKLK